MPTNWKALAEKENAKIFVLPDGWDSRDAVAEQLECSPEKVDDNLRPALKSGKVQKQQFRVWDAGLKRVLPVIAYHDTSRDNNETAPIDGDVVRKLKSEGKTWPQIGKLLGRSAEAVRAVARRAS